uniref:D-aminoacyl-tRNA deacylase n=1 Tax=Cyanothece sp. (strain PCC 7425 / ATCC 29141) TaxID=395961 RepID=DTD_CYAP4|nr:RecName: Full=D-aminoacyl-tRNA deacylase; Short=DTD; AltName: Full=Gly-tRNA(Ala) deacylase [Cyanothece sp. PCC 7425]
MRVVIQRVKASRVEVDGEVIGTIGRGLNLLVGISRTDTIAEVEWMVRKCLDLRLFPDEKGSLALSVQEMGAELLVVSQFTLYGDGRKGRRPSFDRAAGGEQAQTLYDRFVAGLRQSGLRVETGQFGAMMEVFILNDGPVTLLLEREAPLEQEDNRDD